MTQLLLSWPPISEPAKPPKRKYKPRAIKPKTCWCGEPSVTIHCGTYACQRCYEIDSNRWDRHCKGHKELSVSQRENRRLGIGHIYSVPGRVHNDNWDEYTGI